MLWYSQPYHKTTFIQTTTFLSRMNWRPEEKLLTQTFHCRIKQCYLEGKNKLAEMLPLPPTSMFSSVYELGQNWIHMAIVWAIESSTEKSPAVKSVSPNLSRFKIKLLVQLIIQALVRCGDLQIFMKGDSPHPGCSAEGGGVYSSLLAIAGS